MLKDNAKQLMLQVRESYRLLYQYQERIIDLVDFIGRKYGLTYNGGYPKFSWAAPRNGSGDLNRWAWDWLNMYFYEFNFKRMTIDKEGFYDFSIFLVNDTGFFKANEQERILKTSVSDYADTNDSESHLIFVVGKDYWEGWGYNWDEPEFMLQEQGEKFENGDKNKKMFFKHYPIETFSCEEDALTNIKDFETLCIQKGYDLRICNPLKK